MVGGFCAPFDLAILTLGLGGVLIVSTWTENFGAAGSDSGSNASTQTSPLVDDAEAEDSIAGDNESVPPLPSQGWVSVLCKHLGLTAASTFTLRAVRTITDKPSVAKLAAVCSLFEGAMFAFVFEWTPALEHSTKNAAEDGSDPDPIPFGVVFAAFMVACAGGSEAFALLMGRRDRAVARAAASSALGPPSSSSDVTISSSQGYEKKGRSKSGSFDSDILIGGQSGHFNPRLRLNSSGEEVESENLTTTAPVIGHLSEADILFLVCSVGAASLFFPALLPASPTATFVCFRKCGKVLFAFPDRH
jgi:hypothetical protein